MTKSGTIFQFPHGGKLEQEKKETAGKHDIQIDGILYKFHIKKTECGYDILYTTKIKIPPDLATFLTNLNPSFVSEDGFGDKPVSGEHVHIRKWYKHFMWTKRMFLKWRIRELKKELRKKLERKEEKEDELLNV